MPGTKAGAAKTAATNRAKYGEDFYARIGRTGGSVSRRETRHFYLDREAARNGGRTGGMKSKRPSKKGTKGATASKHA